MRKTHAVLLTLGLSLQSISAQSAPSHVKASPGSSGGPNTRTPFRVAFVGDQGLTDGSYAVLRMIRDEKTDLLVIPGDFDYQHKPKAWAKMLDETVGDMPIFAAIGNHDLLRWWDYQKILKKRLEKIPNANCTGDVGVKQNCFYRGVNFVISGIGTLGWDHEEFIQSSLQAHKTPFKICVWHKNQRRMQVGSKTDEVGWEAYEICRREGAFIITAHEHSYERTHVLKSFKYQEVANRSSVMELERGKSFAIVSGLGGKSIRDESKEGNWWDDLVSAFGKDDFNPAKGEWWANIYTADQNANHGVLFCDFFKNNSPQEASCYFKNIDDQIIDEFTIVSGVDAGDVNPFMQ